VETIGGKTIEDFKKVTNIYPLAIDIDYEDYTAGLPVRGEVKYSDLGWLAIDDGYTLWERFKTSLPVPVQSIHSFFFWDIEITQESLVGRYSPFAPHVDYVTFSFTAKTGSVDE
jgi:hypothetical protein